MDTVVLLLVLSALPQLVAPQTITVTQYKAVVQSVSGLKRIFSGETIKLRCSIPDAGKSFWTFNWFRNSQPFTGESQEELTLWNLHVRDSGKYYCQGERDSPVGKIRTLLSTPIEIIVDGGWVLLQVPVLPSLVGGNATVRCNRRTPRNVPYRSVILYKDGVEVMKQNGLNQDFYLTNLTLKDRAMYTCRVSWDLYGQTYSVISVPVLLEVLEVLTEPSLKFVTSNVPPNKMQLVCHHEYNARPPVPRHYYFYKDGKRLGVATSEDHDLVPRAPGTYSCRVKVPRLDIVRESVPKTYGRVTEPQAVKPPVLPPRMSRPQAPPRPSPELSPPLTAEPLASLISHSSGPPTSQPATNTPLTTAQPLIQTTSVETSNTTEGSVDMFEGSGDISEESGEEFSDLPDPTGSTSG